MTRVPSWSALAIAATLQAAAVTWLSGHERLAIWVAAAAAGGLVWQFTRRRSKLALVLLNAILLTLPSIRGFGSHPDGDTGPDQDAATPSNRKDTGDGAAIIADNTFPGVILFPDVRDHATLVPPLPSMRRDLFGPNQRDSLGIPFFGSYALYKRPQTRLPKNAVTMRGDPDAKTFRSTDLKPMVMEAHQNLAIFIPSACCREIQMAIRNADRYPGSVSMELELIDSGTPGKPSFRIGPVQVTSNPRWSFGRRSTMLETLSFEMPPSPPIQRFDEFTVRFLLGPVRADHSAGIAIERFVLIPRGM